MFILLSLVLLSFCEVPHVNAIFISKGKVRSLIIYLNKEQVVKEMKLA